MPTEPRNASVVYPGGIRARWRWAGSGQGPDVFALSEAGGGLIDVGDAAGPGFDGLCRAELRADVPGGAWTVRFASTIYDEPAAFAWDGAGLLVVKYGFHAFGIETRTGAERWRHRSATPILGVYGSSRLSHVLVQSELETFALDPDGTVTWRIAHSDVVTEAVLVGGRLVLTSFGGQQRAVDPQTGRTAG
jgi:hypothetical protein